MKELSPHLFAKNLLSLEEWMQNTGGFRAAKDLKSLLFGKLTSEKWKEEDFHAFVECLRSTSSESPAHGELADMLLSSYTDKQDSDDEVSMYM